MFDNVKEAVERLRKLNFEVIVSTEDTIAGQDCAVCAVMDTIVMYYNPHYEYQRGWTEARMLSMEMGKKILDDIALVCEALDNVDR